METKLTKYSTSLTYLVVSSKLLFDFVLVSSIGSYVVHEQSVSFNVTCNGTFCIIRYWLWSLKLVEAGWTSFAYLIILLVLLMSEQAHQLHNHDWQSDQRIVRLDR